ncbi:MAG TPA: hypothetical protein VD794_10500 [Flavisolibacter sp.]|nr:hypothetical protein [Flavisolibacter sp.]
MAPEKPLIQSIFASTSSENTSNHPLKIIVEMKSVSLGYYFSYYRNYIQYRKNKKEYYKQYLQFEDLASIRQLIEKQSDVVTNSAIQFYNLTHGSTTAEVSRVLGTPVCAIKNQALDSLHSIFCYKKRVGAISLLTYCHFWDNKLFMVQSCYPNSKKFTWNSVIELLQRKYKFNIKDFHQSISIENGFSGKIVIENDINLNLFYISNTDGVRSIINSIASKKERIKKITQAKVLEILEPYV